MIKQLEWACKLSCMQWNRTDDRVCRFSSSRVTRLLISFSEILSQHCKLKSCNLVTEVYNMSVFPGSWQILLNFKMKGSTFLASSCNIHWGYSNQSHWELNLADLWVKTCYVELYVLYDKSSSAIWLTDILKKNNPEHLVPLSSHIFSQFFSLPSLNLIPGYKPSLAKVFLCSENFHQIIT